MNKKQFSMNIIFKNVNSEQIKKLKLQASKQISRIINLASKKKKVWLC